MAQTDFDGPRRIRLEEAASGNDLFKICFGGGLGDVIEAAQPVKRGGWFVITHNDRVVSQLGLSHFQVDLYGSRLNIGSIGGVSTHPDYRGLGLAGRLLAHSAQLFTQEGARLMLISGERGLYTRTGNIQAMEMVAFTLRAIHKAQPVKSPHFELRPLTQADQSICARLYQAEPVRFVRRIEEFQDALHHNQGWLVEQEGIPQAYLLLHTPWEYDDLPEQGIREVVEYAGSRMALVEGMRRVLSGETPFQPPIHELRLVVPWQEMDFIRLLADLGEQAGTIPLPGHTMRLVNFTALQRDLAVYIAARLLPVLRGGLRFEQTGPLLVDPALGAPSNGRMAITWKGKQRSSERLELSSAEMTRLVMGGEKPPQLHGALGEIVPALFPLPSFLIGINYR